MASHTIKYDVFNVSCFFVLILNLNTPGCFQSKKYIVTPCVCALHCLYACCKTSGHLVGRGTLKKGQPFNIMS
jgi:hypothetical protein